LPDGAASAALLLPLAVKFASEHPKAVRRAGYRGSRLTLGSALFRAILNKRSGVTFSERRFEGVWSLLKSPDKNIHLEIPEMLDAWQALANEATPGADSPFILTLGERRAYNANLIFRDPAWRKIDPSGALRLNPEDVAVLGLRDGDNAQCESERGQLECVVEIDQGVRHGVAVLPHGYGVRYMDSAPLGPEINRLTSSTWCAPLVRTPSHKYVPGSVRKTGDGKSRDERRRVGHRT